MANKELQKLLNSGFEIDKIYCDDKTIYGMMLKSRLDNKYYFGVKMPLTSLEELAYI